MKSPANDSILLIVNGMVPWPVGWDLRWRSANRKCDMLVGPCACGAWHLETDSDTIALLKAYAVRIMPASPMIGGLELVCGQCNSRFRVIWKEVPDFEQIGFCPYCGNSIEEN